MKKIIGGHAVVRALEFLKVDTVFGIPGVHNLAIYAALLDSSIKHVTARHEQSAGFMADGYARSTGKVGVALVISGPGLTNVLTAMGEAYHEAIPMLVISTNIPTRYLGGRTGMLHELASSNAMVNSVAKESRRIPTTEAIVPYLIEAHQLALEGRPGPVHVEIPIDLLDQKISVPSVIAMSQISDMLKPSNLAFDEQTLDQASDVLMAAKNPLMILGGGAWQAKKNLTRLAEKCGLPILLTPASKGSIDEDHPLCLGVRSHFPCILKHVADADVVLAFGTELGEDLWGHPFSTKGVVIRVDKDASSFERNVRGHICLTDDADHAAALFLERTMACPERMELAHQQVKDLKEKASQEISKVFAYGDLSDIVDMLDAIRKCLPKDSILVNDSTRAAYVAFSEYPSHFPRSFLFPCGYGTLGMGLPSAIGVKLAHPGRAVCVLVGDGGFQFTMAELGTACQENLNIPIIIWNDHGFGEIRIHEEARHPGRRIAVDLKNPDFASLATAYKIPFHHVLKSSELKDALTVSMSEEGPSLIEIDRSDSL